LFVKKVVTSKKRPRGRPRGSAKKESPATVLLTPSPTLLPSPSLLRVSLGRSSKRDRVVRTIPISEEVSIERKEIVSSFTSLSLEEILDRLSANPPIVFERETELMAAGFISYDITPLLEQRRVLLQKLDKVSFEVNKIVYKEFCSLRCLPIPNSTPPAPRELEKISVVVKDILTKIYK
jgi:hypothetical protein